MKRIIKLTEEQLHEAIDNGFNYLDGGDTPNYSGQTFISASGHLDIDEYGDPVTSDKISKTLSPQTYSRNTIGTQTYRQRTNENDNNMMFPEQHKKEEKTEKPKEAEIENAEDNTEIPMGVESKMEMFVKALQTTDMNPKQKGIVLNKLVSMLNLEGVPFNWKKELITKIKQ